MRDALPVRVRFGDFELDLRTRELLQGERNIPLQEQPFQVLLMLVERGGEIATRVEIQKKLWPNDTVVEFDQSINAAIKKLRKALGDSAEEPKYINENQRFNLPHIRKSRMSGAPCTRPSNHRPNCSHTGSVQMP
jgi:DNA-binding response OmpR family regulator